MSYLLDTDIIIHYLRGDEEVVSSLKKLVNENLHTTPINVSELFYGAYNSNNKEKHIKEILQLLGKLKVINITIDVCNLFGKVKSELKKKGELIDNFDLLIACTCLANGYTLITRNVKHFEKIRGLDVLRI